VWPQRIRNVYEWSNISRQYLWDVSDWRQLCLYCHRAVDAVRPTHCKRGHEFTPENTFYQVRRFGEGRITRSCQICRTDATRRWYGHNKWRPGGPGRPPKIMRHTYE